MPFETGSDRAEAWHLDLNYLIDMERFMRSEAASAIRRVDNKGGGLDATGSMDDDLYPRSGTALAFDFIALQCWSGLQLPFRAK